MPSPGPSLDDLWSLAAQHHGALKRYVLARAESWADPAIRRTAHHGLAILTAMIRRLICLMALGVVLPPLRPRAHLAPIPRLTPPRKPRHHLRLTDTPRDRPRRTANPAPTPDTPDLSRTLLLERLAVLAAAYRARRRIARRIARRVQSASTPRLRAASLTPALRARIPEAAARLLDHIDTRIRLSARAPP
jgi:hypothetical protein